MAIAPPLWRVMCDTNVFYPVSLADLVLSSAEYGLFELAWSLDLLAETERVLVETKGLAPDNARVFVDQIKATFPDGEIDHGKYVRLIDELTGNDPDDLIHLAAAIAEHVDVIMTNDVDDFVKAVVPSGFRRPAIMPPDEYFSALIQEGLGDDLRAITIDMARRCTRPPVAWDEVLERLGRVGLRATIERLRSS